MKEFFSDLSYRFDFFQLTVNGYVQGSKPEIKIPEDHELSIFTNQLYDGIDWIYSYSESFFAFEFRV
jgi:hypothetical protein